MVNLFYLVNYTFYPERRTTHFLPGPLYKTRRICLLPYRLRKFRKAILYLNFFEIALRETFDSIK